MSEQYFTIPFKTNTKDKSKKQRKDNQSKEELPKAQPAKTEGETKQTVEEKTPAVVDRPSTSEKTKDELWEECVSLQEQQETAHQSEICGLKIAATATTSKTPKKHVESEVELQKKMHNLQVDKGEKECRTKVYTGKLKQKQQAELREINEIYEKQVTVSVIAEHDKA